MRPIRASPDLSLRVEALPENVPAVRHAIGDVAARRGAEPRARNAIALAVTEAVANVVVHAYETAGGPLEIEARADDDALTVVVRDHGGGMRADAPSEGIGAGLRLIGALAQSFDIRRTDGATEVRMEFLLRPSVRLDD
ncbi:ATP-binding protein [Paraconexibacter sp.]|uniref:ATP-binding protein n=1 Tax=Paraconexibacter sp. TaxID=2949640 RepID=UPI00356A74C2